MVVRRGTGGDDTLIGTAAADQLHGLGGDDFLQRQELFNVRCVHSCPRVRAPSPDYLASSFIARSRPCSVVGNMRPSISSRTMPIDWR